MFCPATAGSKGQIVETPIEVVSHLPLLNRVCSLRSVLHVGIPILVRRIESSGWRWSNPAAIRDFANNVTTRRIETVQHVIVANAVYASSVINFHYSPPVIHVSLRIGFSYYRVADTSLLLVLQMKDYVVSNRGTIGRLLKFSASRAGLVLKSS